MPIGLALDHGKIKKSPNLHMHSLDLIQGLSQSRVRLRAPSCRLGIHHFTNAMEEFFL